MAHNISSSKTLLHQESIRQASPSNTVYYSVSDTEESPQRAADQPRIRKKYKPATPDTPTPVVDFQLEEPNWEQHEGAWGFLQSQNPEYPSKYLVKEDPTSQRPGYLLGRKLDCDIVFHREDISKAHCLIYKETGANQKAKGIRIFLKDTSFNGTFVDGRLVGAQKRVLLKSGNKIQLVKPPPREQDEHMRHKFFRILFPPTFEAQTCETMFNMDRVLGKGNFAIVSHATNRVTGEEVAIKVLFKSRFEKKPKMLESIVEEVSIMMGLRQHPLLVKMKNIYNELQKIYLVLEYVPGGELFHYVVKNKKLDEDRTRFIFWQLLMAIKFLHNNNIAHRDLKPENVLLVDEKTLHIKISDFGLAKTEYRDKSFGSQCGTPNYVAPEILYPSEIRAYDRQCDLWSLGVILFICLCGYPPFSEENSPPSMKNQIKDGLFTFASPYWDNISEEAKDLIRRLLTVDPNQRIRADEALEHSWMYQNPKYMQKMQEGLGDDFDMIMSLGDHNSLSLTQMAHSQV